jgi:hypothetical protein
MGVSKSMIPQPEDWFKVYKAAGLRVIPIYGGKFKDGSPNPKNPGHLGWQKPDWTMLDWQIINDFRKTERWGVVGGAASGNLYIVDYDLDDNFGSVQAARDWRKSHIELLRSLKTWVSFTPSGGIQIFFRSNFELAPDLSSAPLGGVISRAIKPLTDAGVMYESIRSEGQQCLLPPSVIAEEGKRVHKGTYFFLDSQTILQGSQIRKV